MTLCIMGVCADRSGRGAVWGAISVSIWGLNVEVRRCATHPGMHQDASPKPGLVAGPILWDGRSRDWVQRAAARPAERQKYLLVKKATKQYLFDLRGINSQLAAERNPLRHARPTLPEIDMRTPPPVCLLAFATVR